MASRELARVWQPRRRRIGPGRYVKAPRDPFWRNADRIMLWPKYPLGT